MSPYVYDPHSGGIKIPSGLQAEILRDADAFSRKRPWHPKFILKLRFRNQFCYVDTQEEGDTRVFRLCRLRYFRAKKWSLALFTYSNERYEPCVFTDGQWEGSLEDALKLSDSFII